MMPKPKRIIASDVPYHLYARCSNRDWFQLPMKTVWEIYSDYLCFLQRAFEFRLHAFVLMHNHFHLLATPTAPNISEAMNYFLRETSRVIGFETNRINQVYGGPYGATVIFNDHHFNHAYKYVYRNPSDAGLVTSVEDYPYSTLSGLLGKSRISIPLEEDVRLFDDASLNSTLSWLNSEFRKRDRELIRSALHKGVFRIARDETTKGKSHLETGPS